MREFLIALYINGMFIVTYFLSKYIHGYQTIALVFLLAVLALVKLNKVIITRSDLLSILPYLIFGIHLSFSLWWTPTPSYGLFKVQGYFLSVLVIIVSTYLYVKSNSIDLGKVLEWIKLFSVLAVFLLVIDNSGLVLGSRSSIKGTNSIWLARYIAIGALVIYSNMRFLEINIKKSIVHVIVFGGLIIGILMNGSRGPLISLIATVLVIECLYFLKNSLSLKSAFKIIVVFTGIVLSVVILLNSLSRLSIEYLSGDINFIERVNFLKVSMANLSQSGFFGLGSGSFSSVYRGIDSRLYPHNIALEVFLETGFLGFGLLIWMLYNGLKIQQFADYRFISWYSISLFLLFTSLMSGDIFGNASLFVVIYITTIIKKIKFKGEKCYYEN